MQDLPVILKCHNLQSLDKPLEAFIELNLCKDNFTFCTGVKNKVATYNFGSVHILKKCLSLQPSVNRLRIQASVQCICFLCAIASFFSPLFCVVLFYASIWCSPLWRK